MILQIKLVVVVVVVVVVGKRYLHECIRKLLCVISIID